MSVEPETRHERGARERSNENHLFLVSRFAIYRAKPPVLQTGHAVFPVLNVIEERSCDELYKRVLVKEAVMPKV